MNNPAPLQTPWLDGSVPPAWASWFKQVFDGLSGWSRSISYSATLDFSNIPANSELSLPVSMTGVRQGASVLPTPLANIPGLFFAGVVTADDTVTIYAKNFTTGAINPAPITFRISVLQN